MKITILLMAIIALTSTAQAGYRIVIPMEQSKGGPLPNGSISITPKTPSLPVENWQPAEPVYGNWINFGTYFGCDNEKWTGSQSWPKGVPAIYRARNSTCKINQTRTVQEREIETTTLSYRNVGDEKTETRTLIDQTYLNMGECKFGPTEGAWNVYWRVDAEKNNTLFVNGDGRSFYINGDVSSFFDNGLKRIYFKGDKMNDFTDYELCFIGV